jgi:branched-chain amino acid transport system substrate-binding protein
MKLGTLGATRRGRGSIAAADARRRFTPRQWAPVTSQERNAMIYRLTRRELGRGTAAAGAWLAVGSRARAQSAPLKLGVLLPRSGFEALIGQGCQRGYDLAALMLRDMGMPVELMTADTESKPEVARTQAERLIREGAQVLSGAFDSGQTTAIAQVCEQQGIPFIVNIAADPKLTEQGYKFVFRNFPTAPMLASGALTLIKDLFAATGRTPKTAVLMAINDTFGQAAQNAFNVLMPKLEMPFRLVEVIPYDPQARDLSVEVAKAKATGADLHLCVTRLNDAILMVREMVKQRYSPMAFISPGAPGVYERPFARTLGKYAEYCFSNNPWLDPKQPLVKSAEEVFTKTFPDDAFDINIGFSFEAALVAADAHKRAGSTKPAALVEALRTTDIKNRMMIGEPIRFDAKGQNTGIGHASLQIRDGKPTVVLPAANAVLKPVFPVPGWAERG